MSTLKESLGGNLRQYGITGALLLIVVLFEITTGGRLLMPNNVAALVQQNAYVMILAIGMVMVIVAGHIDLSVGSVVAFVGGICALLMKNMGWPWWLAVLASLAVGVLVGVWQGFWIAYVRIPAFIVTLAGMLIFRGLAIVLVGTTVSPLPAAFNKISNGSLPHWLGSLSGLDGMTLLIGVLAVAGLVYTQIRSRANLRKHHLATEPLVTFAIKQIIIVALIGYITYLLSKSAGGTPIVLVLVGLLIVGYTFVLNRSVFGRHVYAIGGNLNAAILSGVNTRRVNFGIFVNMGLLAAVAAIVTTSRAGAGVAAAGMNYELDAIAACFIGGTAVTGGIGKVSGAMIGALVMGVLNMGLSIMNVDSAWQQSIKGLVLLLAVALDLLGKRRAA